MIANAIHLMFGNAIIALVEGLLLSWLLKLSKLKCILWLLVANYLSSYGGQLALYGLLEYSSIGNFDTKHLDITEAWFLVWTLVLSAYLMALVMEWPFVCLCIGRRPGWFRQSLQGTLATQTASYLLLFGWYWLLSGSSYYRQLDIVPFSEIRPPELQRIFFISSEDGHVYVLDSRSGSTARIAELNSSGRKDRLLILPDMEDSNTELVACLDKSESARSSCTYRTIQPNFPVVSEDGMLGLMESVDIAALRDRTAHQEQAVTNWEYRPDWIGLEAINKKTKERLYVSFDLLFTHWEVQRFIHLPSDYLILQLGSRQICLLDPWKRKIALITHGRGPIAVLSGPAQDKTDPR